MHSYRKPDFLARPWAKFALSMVSKVRNTSFAAGSAFLPRLKQLNRQFSPRRYQEKEMLGLLAESSWSTRHPTTSSNRWLFHSQARQATDVSQQVKKLGECLRYSRPFQEGTASIRREAVGLNQNETLQLLRTSIAAALSRIDPRVAGLPGLNLLGTLVPPCQTIQANSPRPR
jgi:hypothetical protein